MDKSIGEQQKLVKRFLLGLELSNLFHFKLFWGRKKARARRMGAAQRKTFCGGGAGKNGKYISPFLQSDGS